MTTKRNGIGVLMGVELVLNGANVNFIAFSRYSALGLDGQVFSLFVIVLAAAEAADWPAFRVLRHRNNQGKTEALLMSYGVHTGKGYGSRWLGAIFREEYKELEDIILKSQRIFPSVFPRARFKESTGSLKWVWPDGEQLLFRVGKNAGDYWNYHGQEIPINVSVNNNSKKSVKTIRVRFPIWVKREISVLDHGTSNDNAVKFS